MFLSTLGQGPYFYKSIIAYKEMGISSKYLSNLGRSGEKGTETPILLF